MFTARPDTLLDGARRKKKIAAGNILTPDSTDELIEGVDDIPTPDDLDTPDDMEGELEWEGKLADSSLVRKKGLLNNLREKNIGTNLTRKKTWKEKQMLTHEPIITISNNLTNMISMTISII